ncbi:MAG: ABC transporter ATP-binding protein [Tissierellia bacterium]|nr:ABC transporter ATP-binding protein [Tissierellia bacterium]
MVRFFTYLKKVRPFVHKSRWKIVTTISMNLLIVGLSLLYPIMNKTLIDEIILQSQWQRLPMFIIQLSCLYISTIALSLISNRLFATYTEKIWSDLREELYRRILMQRIRVRRHFTDSDILQRISQDSSYVHSLHAYYMDKILINCIKIIGTSILIFWLSVPLALITCISVPIFFILMKYFSKKFNYEVAEIRRLNVLLRGNLLNTLSFLTTIKANNLEPHFIDGFANDNEKTLASQVRTEHSGYLLRSIISFSTNINQLLVIVVGAILIYNGSITAGVLIAFLGYTMNIYSPFIVISDSLKDLNSAYTAIDRYIEAYEFTGENKEALTAGDAISKIQSVAFEHVTFGYDTELIFQDLSFQANRGEMILLKGRTGVGKSTLAKLLLRFYDPSQGTIYMNGKNIDTYALADVRKEVCWISQEQSFIDGTIGEYFRTFEPFSDEQIREALSKVNLVELDTKLEEGQTILDIEIDREGSTLSGGQRQRLMLARLFLLEPSLIFLDEPFNGIDEKTRAFIWEHIYSHCQDKILFVVDHGTFFDQMANQKILIER